MRRGIDQGKGRSRWADDFHSLSPMVRGSIAKSNPVMVICVPQNEQIACGLMATVGRMDLSDMPEGQGWSYDDSG
jgi:hypothetical protein